MAHGIERERAELSDVRERADVVIDTTGLSIWDLRRISEALMPPDGRPSMHVEFVSFGYKHGVPRDADLLFDVRFLRNPHYVPELRPVHRARPRWRSCVRRRPASRVPGPAGGAARLPAARVRGGGQDEPGRSGSAARAAATAA